MIQPIRIRIDEVKGEKKYSLDGRFPTGLELSLADIKDPPPFVRLESGGVWFEFENAKAYYTPVEFNPTKDAWVMRREREHEYF